MVLEENEREFVQGETLATLESLLSRVLGDIVERYDVDVKPLSVQREQGIELEVHSLVRGTTENWIEKTLFLAPDIDEWMQML